MTSELEPGFFFLPDGNYIAQINAVELRSIAALHGQRAVVLDVRFSLLLSPEIAAKKRTDTHGIKRGYVLHVDPTGGLDVSSDRDGEFKHLLQVVEQDASSQDWYPDQMRKASLLLVHVFTRSV